MKTGHTPGKVDIQKLLDDKIQIFEVAENDPDKNSIIKNLLRHDDERIFFTYALLKKSAKGDCKSGGCSTKSRAITLLTAVNNSALKMALEAKPDAVIILDKTAKALDVASFALTPAEIASINQQLAAPLAINTAGLSSPAMGDGTWKSVSTASPGPFSPAAVVAIDFTAVWNFAKASKGAVYNRDFYHDYFLKTARELYKTDRQVFSVAGGIKNWLNMALTPVIVDALFGSGTIQNDFPWLNEKDPTLQVIGYLSWLKDSGLEGDFVQRAVTDLKNILKGGDVVGAGHPNPEQVRSIGSAAIRLADWTVTKQTFTSAQDVLNHFTSEYGVGAANPSNKQHRFTLAFISSLAYMNQGDALLKPTSCIDLRTAAGADLQAYISEHFCASVDGKRLAR